MEEVKKHIKAIQKEFKDVYGLDVNIYISANNADPVLAENIVLSFDKNDSGFRESDNFAWNKLDKFTEGYEVTIFHKERVLRK